MSYLQKQMDLLRFDKRLLEINMKNGSLTQDQYNQYLSQLSDLENNAEKIELVEESDSSNESMNGESHPASSNEEQASAGTPPNTDPFGSGF
jgi:hypothetical protein